MPKVIIQDRLPTLNELIAAINHNRHVGNKLKQEITELCEIAFRQQCGETYTKQIFLFFHWFEKNKKRDKDNIASAKKFILDGMQRAGTIKTDGWKGIAGFGDMFSIDKENPRVEITITEVT